MDRLYADVATLRRAGRLALPSINNKLPIKTDKFIDESGNSARYGASQLTFVAKAAASTASTVTRLSRSRAE